MVEISKAEKAVISEQLPNVHIVRTMKQKSKRHHYFCEESKRVMWLLQQLRKNTDSQKAGIDYGYRAAQ